MMIDWDDLVILVVGFLLACLLILGVISLVKVVVEPDDVTVYKINKCVMALPPQVSDPVERCTAAVWMEDNK